MQAALPSHTTTEADMATRGLSVRPVQRLRQPAPDILQHAIAGYAGLWLMVDEGQVTTIAAHPDARGRGLGDFAAGIIDRHRHRGRRASMTLEVRVATKLAKAIVPGSGFRIISTRPRYYSDNNEHLHHVDDRSRWAYRQQSRR